MTGLQCASILTLLHCAACGPVVRGDASPNLSVELPTNDELADATTLEHYALDSLLRRHVTSREGPEGGTFRLLDYDALLQPEARLLLSEYLGGLAAVEPRNLASRDEKLAFYLNAYNAWVLLAVLEKFEADPTYNVESDQWALFESPYILLGGRSLSPNGLEHGILRADPYTLDNMEAQEAGLADWALELHDDLYGDAAGPAAEIHLGLNCASVSCPNLREGAWHADTLEVDLEAAAREFLDSPEKGAGPQGISSLFRWFVSDWEGTYGSVEAFVETYRTQGTSDINWDATLPYDWSLNGIDAAL